MKGQAANSEAAMRGFQYPGKAKREGPKFENTFRLQRGEEARLILATDLVWFAGHMMPTRWNDRWGKADYTLQRCSRVTDLIPREDGFDMVAGEDSAKCQYCEHELFGNEPKAYAVCIAYTDHTYTKKNGEKIGPRLVYLVITERDTALLDTLAKDFGRYGFKRKSDHFEDGTLIGAHYIISRGTNQQSRAIGERLEIDRDMNDKPKLTDPVAFLKKLKKMAKQKKISWLRIEDAFPVASPEEQKLLIANATSLNNKFRFVKEDDIISTDIDDDDDDEDIDLFGEASLSGLKDKIADQMDDGEEEEEEEEAALFGEDEEEEEYEEESDDGEEESDEEESDEEDEGEEEDSDDSDENEEESEEDEDDEDEPDELAEEDIELDAAELPTEDDTEDVVPLKDDDPEAFDYVDENPEEEEKPKKKKKKATSGKKKSTKAKSSKKSSKKKKGGKKKKAKA